MEGIYIIDKEKGWTSNDVVQKIKRITKIKKVGHGGTLDPLATGVLVVAVGKTYTKQLTDIIKKEKEYLVDITFGKTSTTDDAEGEMTEKHIQSISTLEDIQHILPMYIGDIQQKPPIYSALKIQGKKAYELARKGKEVDLKERDVHIYDIQIQSYSWPILSLYTKTGSGVYIRSLARDIGEDLNVGGYVSELRRISVGDFHINDAVTIKEFEKKAQEQSPA